MNRFINLVRLEQVDIALHLMNLLIFRRGFFMMKKAISL